jgi:TonB family protein
MIVNYKKYTNKKTTVAAAITLLALCLISFIITGCAHQDKVSVNKSDIVKTPEFPGGSDALSEWLNKNMEYPMPAQRMGIQGPVVVEFTVDTHGKISDPTITKSLHKLCDGEALRLVNAMPDWKPGESNGVKVVMRYILNITFHLQ